MRRRWLLAAIVAAFLATACDKTNREASIFRDQDFTNAGRAGYLVTDAKQRVVFNVPNNRAPAPADKTAQDRIVCAEPSPDVSQALSEALKLALAVKVETQGEGSLGVDRSFSHSIAQLGERLAVIQLLRDKMFRACEAYANGAVQASGYTLMLARLDKTMTTLLSAEMVAGAFGRSLAQLGGEAGTGGVDPDELEKAKTGVTEAAKELQEAGSKTYEDDADNKKRTAAVSAAAKNLQDANLKLFALELGSARTSAAGTALLTSVGKIEEGTGSKDASGTIPGSIVNLHRNYLDDHGLEPLIDACVVAMDAAGKWPEGKTRVAALLNNAQKADVDYKLYQAIMESLLTNGTPFAAFCGLRIFTETNQRHAFIRHFTVLKRDLRGSRITGTEGTDGKDKPVVIAPGVEPVYSDIVEAVIAQREKEALKRRCTELSVILAKNLAMPDNVKTEKAEFESKKCAAVLN
jgi:hypothetical protein